MMYLISDLNNHLSVTTLDTDLMKTMIPLFYNVVQLSSQFYDAMDINGIIK